MCQTIQRQNCIIDLGEVFKFLVRVFVIDRFVIRERVAINSFTLRLESEHIIADLHHIGGRIDASYIAYGDRLSQGVDQKRTIRNWPVRESALHDDALVISVLRISQSESLAGKKCQIHTIY